MKKLISLLLACLILASLSVAGFADDSKKNYEQNQADLKAMADCIEAGTTKIELTDEYFTIPTTLYSHLGPCVKLSFQSSGENVNAAIFILAPDNELAPPIPTQYKQNVPISSTEEEIEFRSPIEQLYIGYGARLGINFLTSVEQDTTITVKVYAKSSSTTSTPYTEAGTITYTLKASEAEEAGTPLEMTVACEDHSSAMPGNQVYVGDEVTVSFENANEFTGTSAVFSFSDAFELTGGVPSGWIKNEDGSYTYTKSEGSSPIGAFILTVKEASNENCELKLVSCFKDSETAERTATVEVVGKPIQYTIKNKAETISQVTTPYNGQKQHIEVIVTEPTNATIQYSTTPLEDQVSGDEVEWADDAPEWVDACYPEAAGHWVGIKITADGYETVTEWLEFYIDRALLTITPNDVTIYVGDRVPTSFTYAVDGLCGDDKLTTAPTFSIDGTVGTSKPGTYTINASGADAGDNYFINYGTATLRVVERPDVPNIPDTYDIDLIVSEGGEAKTNLTNASAGSTITVTVTPDEDYELDYITVDGERIDGTTFTMPAHDVTVRVYFTDGSVDMLFVDVNSGDWFYDYVAYVYANGLMDGTSTTTFEPNANMTRAMVWAILARVDGETVTGTNWIETARTWAMANGVSDGENANGYVTREQLATMLWRYAVAQGYDVSIGESTNILSYADFASISEYAIPAMQWACGSGTVTGVTDSTLAPQGTATRAQCAAMLMRFVEL